MYSVRYRPQVATLALQRWCCSLAFPVGERSWRTRRMARHKRNVSDLPYAAPPFSCAAFFVKEQRAVLRYGTEKGEAFQYRVALFSPKCEDCPHQFCLQPFAYFFVYSKINISSLIIELPHGKTCYVAAEMLQYNLHCVRVAFARRQNNGIGNKGIFRVAVLVTIQSIHQRFPPNIFLTAQRSLSGDTVPYFLRY
ncbi:Uncharacterised protein [Clostridioides difficile]|nr:Uncharacterised protein [Clostridioides difficile]SJT69859.1 Uncharacterised protein [Clostridioides difficile]